MQILDTCAFIWLCAEPQRLSRKVGNIIRSTADELVVSHISFMEIGMKWSAGKIQLPEPPRYWIPRQMEMWNLQQLSLHAEDYFKMTELEKIHKDPFDRLLIAQALRCRASILTPDREISAYPVKTVW